MSSDLTCCFRNEDYALALALEPDVRIVPKKDVTIEEYRIRGRLYRIKVIPVKGPPYYLLDQDSDGRMETKMSEIYSDFVAPSWVLFSW